MLVLFNIKLHAHFLSVIEKPNHYFTLLKSLIENTENQDLYYLKNAYSLSSSI